MAPKGSEFGLGFVVSIVGPEKGDAVEDTWRGGTRTREGRVGTVSSAGEGGLWGGDRGVDCTTTYGAE